MSSTGHESYALRPGPIVLSAVLLAVMLLLAFWGMDRLADRLDAEVDEPALHGLAVERELPPSPRLQARPAEEIEAHRRAVDGLAARFEWIDEPVGVVRIPLEHALELAVERGLPRFEAPEGRGAEESR